MSDTQTPTKIELLSFRLADQEYALDIMSVREIRSWTKATPLPHAPDHILGVINLRGTVLPVMDLTKRLGFAGRSQLDRRVIIVVKQEGVMTGLLVDAVSDIITISNDDLQPPPELSPATDANVVSALTLVDDRMIRVLDLSVTIAAHEGLAA